MFSNILAVILFDSHGTVKTTVNKYSQNIMSTNLRIYVGLKIKYLSQRLKVVDQQFLSINNISLFKADLDLCCRSTETITQIGCSN